MIEDLKPLIRKFIIFAKDNLKFQRPPRLFLRNDAENSTCALGKTAHYDPGKSAITLYITNRHPKDILRSFAHELVHHCQNERGDLAPEKMKTLNKNYAQENDHMRKMEQEAYLMGNMCFRDWEDGLDNKLQYRMHVAEQKYLKENKKMSVKITKKFLKEAIQKVLENKTKLSEQDRDRTAAMDKIAANMDALDTYPGPLGDLYKTLIKASRNPKQHGKEYFSAALAIQKPVQRLAKNQNNTSALRGLTVVGPDGKNPLQRFFAAAQKTGDKALIAQVRKQVPAVALALNLNLDKLNIMIADPAKQPVRKEENEQAFAPSHYCVHHGGVEHNGEVHEAKAVGHNWSSRLNKVTHYDMELLDGTILENVAVEDIMVTKASLAEGSFLLEGSCSHSKHKTKRMKENEELEEISTDQLAAAAGDPEKVESEDFPAAFGKKKTQSESKIQTPEQENTLYEQRFTKKNTKLFEKLLKEWTK